MQSLDAMRTDRLLLERLRPAHVDDLRRLHSDPRVMATLGGVRSHEETQRVLMLCAQHWEEHGFGLWALRERATGQFAGRGGLQYTHVGGHDEVEVAYALLPQYWGQGLASEFAAECVRIGFEILRRSDLVCFTLTTNRASQRVMEKAGFRYERDLTHADLPHVLYRLTAAEWRGTHTDGR